jgi:hypothetical protein
MRLLLEKQQNQYGVHGHVLMLVVGAEPNREHGVQYPNLFALVKELGIPNPFTPFTPSGFWTPEGLTCSAPIFSEQQQLPALIGQFVYTSPLFR